MKDHPEKPPFEKHRYYYLFIKISVIVIVGLLTLHYFGSM